MGRPIGDLYAHQVFPTAIGMCSHSTLETVNFRQVNVLHLIKCCADEIVQQPVTLWNIQGVPVIVAISLSHKPIFS